MEPSNVNFLLMFSVGIGVILLLAFCIVLFVIFYQKRILSEQLKRQMLEAEYQQKMLQAALESQEKERSRLASDLHDSVGAMLSTIRLSLHPVVKAGNGQPLDQTKQLLDETIETVRRISRDLLPTGLEKFGLTHAVREMCERVSSSGIIEVMVSETGDRIEMDKKREVLVYRIVQEIVNNAIRHSKASLLKVTLVWGQTLELVIQDNGEGFDYEGFKNHQGKSGLGLYNIETRASLLGAKLNFDSVFPKGSQFTLKIPTAA
ncbi:MAG: sensor histidine kinase [Cytophagia bacterium]|nr:sensor histidine kinase [Cytophagia bacterium]NBW38023.1 sensor histidine kinase [Cytophagia bacterium]